MQTETCLHQEKEHTRLRSCNFCLWVFLIAYWLSYARWLRWHYTIFKYLCITSTVIKNTFNYQGLDFCHQCSAAYIYIYFFFVACISVCLTRMEKGTFPISPSFQFYFWLLDWHLQRQSVVNLGCWNENNCWKPVKILFSGLFFFPVVILFLSSLTSLNTC